MGQKKLIYTISLFCVFLLFLPKLNIISFESETAGVRIDDFVLMFFCFTLGCAFHLNNKKVNQLEICLLFIVITAFLSFISNRLLVESGELQVRAKIFYVFRIFEYFLFFYVGRVASNIFSLDQIVRSFLYLNVLVMVLQKLGIVGKMTSFGTHIIDTSRVTGIASFPAEMGVLLNMIFCYLLLNKPKKGGSFNIALPPLLKKVWEKSRPLRLFLIFTCLTVLTGARIAVLATLFIFFLYLFKKNKKNALRFTLTFSAIIIATLPLIYVLIVNTEGISSRSSNLISLSNYEIIATAWNEINTNIELDDNITLIEGNYDMSWWMRIHKWCYALKIYVTHPECYLQGIGPGTFTAALDGGFLRILTETGIAGCIFYWLFFRYIYRQSDTLKWIILSFGLNMLFFDVYLAYKTMSFLFFISGNYYAIALKNNFIKRYSPPQTKTINGCLVL